MCEEADLNMTNPQSKRYLDDDRDLKKKELITEYLLLYVAFRQEFMLLNYV